jgi:hypothetical protein
MWLHHGWASNPLRLHPTSLSYVFKRFSSLISCEWVYGPGSIFRNFGVGTDLSDVVTSWLSLKHHLDGFTNPYHIYIKCFCTLISCEWVYDTTLSPILPLSLGKIFRNFGVGTDLSDEVTSWLSLKSHLECFTNPYHIYVDPRMGTISLCVLGLPVCELVAVPVRMRTGIPVCIRQSPYAYFRIWGSNPWFPICARTLYAYG